VLKETTMIVVPAFNEEHAIGATVAELRAQWPRVVVVDDGSVDGTAVAARRSGATVVRHILNRGQGAALQTGLCHALASGARFIVTFDGDGQHRVDDVARMLEPLVEGRADVTLGSRFLGSTENMPRRRGLLLRLAVLFTRFASGAHFTDTHNGLRAFTRAAASAIEIRMDRMAHASELLDQIAAHGLRFVEVPVHVRYSAYSRAKGQKTSGALRILVDYIQGRWLR
jgi:polyprenyl-phospho-N-acetylgalactosaminyl synthase